MLNVGDRVPNVVLPIRVDGEFRPMETGEQLAGKRVIIFSLPGAFTPTCSTYQLPGFEEMYNDFKEKGIDEIYCSSVNDGFVMNAWADYIGINNVKLIPDGNGELAASCGMLIDLSVVGFGKRSRRFAMIVNDGVVEKAFVEPESTEDNPDPYGESSPENILKHL